MKKSAFVMLFLCATVAAQFNQDTLKRWMNSGPAFDFILIDLRGPADNITHLIANDLCKPYNLVWPDEFKASISRIQKDKHVVVYCRSGGRSGQAYSYLISEGYSNVYDAGGFMTWNDTTRAFSENSIMADTLLPAPSMVPSTGIIHALFNREIQMRKHADILPGNIRFTGSICLNGRGITNGTAAATGIVLERSGLVRTLSGR